MPPQRRDSKQATNTTLESLSAAHRAEFEKRLSVYGLDASAVIESDLIVPPKTTMLLSANDAQSYLHPRILNTEDLDELKAWIGIPNVLFEAGKLDRGSIVLPTSVAPTIPARKARATAAVSTEADAARIALPAEHLVNLRTAAQAYIFGDSQLVTGYKTAIEHYFPHLQINFWPFYTITVYPGSILTIGAGQNVLFAWKILIYEGGLVYAPYGNLKTDAVVLQKA